MKQFLLLFVFSIISLSAFAQTNPPDGGAFSGFRSQVSGFRFQVSRRLWAPPSDHASGPPEKAPIRSSRVRAGGRGAASGHCGPWNR